MTIATHYRSCNLCEAICGLEIQAENGRLVSIRGDAADPFSRGHICPKAVALIDIEADPDRLRAPVRRIDGGWEEIGWDAAFEILAEQLGAIIETHGPDAVATYHGNPNVHNWGMTTHSAAFFGLLKTRNRFTATSTDQLPHQLVTLWLYGHQLLIPVPDIDHTQHLLILGGNPLASNGSMMTVPDVARRLAALQARGGRLVVIDPRRTETAAIANEHHFIRPGTDAALLLAMLSTLIEAGLVRPGHLAEFLDGWDMVEEAVRPFTAVRAAGVTGIPAGTIERLARDFAAAPSAVAYGRMGVSVQRHGTLCQWLIQLLNIATGNLDRPGGALVTLPAADLVNSRPQGFGRWTGRASGLPEALGELPAATLADEILFDGPERVRALVTAAANPVLSAPNGGRLDQALASLDFMAAIDFYINETTRHAHLILPPTPALQRDHYDLIFNAFAVRNIARYNAPVLPKPKDGLDDWEILARAGEKLAARLGQAARPIPAPRALLADWLAKGPWPLDLAALDAAPHGIDLGALQPSFPGRLATPDKRIKAAPPQVLSAFAAMEQELFAPRSASLVLIGRRDLRSNNSWMHNYHRLVKGKPRCRLMVNLEDFAKLNLKEGQRVRLSSRVGSVEVEVEASEDVMPGVVSLPHGWGHDRKGIRAAVASAHSGVSANDLTDHLFLDAVSGNAAFNGVRVELHAIE